MDPEQKLMALKKAYTDILLNTAKEAAARVMVSERKSARLEHEINVSKEQAVQMLLRLKQMTDLKISEAQTNSLSQQKRIEELEAQLHEAEDIVKELRDELRDTNDELDRVRKSHPKEKKPEFTKPEIKSSATVFMEKSALDQISEAYNTYQDDIDGIGSDDIVEPNNAPIIKENRANVVALQDEVNKGLPENRHFQMGISEMSKPNIPSIISKSKGTEPYMNRRTQRIRAFEEKLMAGELTFSNTIDRVKNNANGKADGDNEEICKKSNKMKTLMSVMQKVKSLKRKRGRGTRNKKNSIPLFGHLPEQALGGDITSDISSGELNSDKNDDELDENPLDMLSRLSEDIQDECTLSKCTKNDVSKTVGLQSESADVGKVDVPLVSLKKVAAGMDCEGRQPPSKEKVFKYTFQRRKKNSVWNRSVLSKIMKAEEEMKKQDDPMDTEKSASIAESSRDSRRVAQVARQLISLSEKKW